jgi:hypothetical protein
MKNVQPVQRSLKPVFLGLFLGSFLSFVLVSRGKKAKTAGYLFN